MKVVCNSYFFSVSALRQYQFFLSSNSFPFITGPKNSFDNTVKFVVLICIYNLTLNFVNIILILIDHSIENAYAKNLSLRYTFSINQQDKFLFDQASIGSFFNMKSK